MNHTIKLLEAMSPGEAEFISFRDSVLEGDVDITTLWRRYEMMVLVLRRAISELHKAEEDPLYFDRVPVTGFDEVVMKLDATGPIVVTLDEFVHGRLVPEED